MNTFDDKELRKNWSVACHASALMGFVFPFGNILGPVCVWLMNKDRYPEVMIEGKKAINFQISVAIILFAIGLLTGIFSSFLPFEGVPTYLLISLGSWIPLGLSVIKSYKMFNEESFEYPISYSFLK